MSSVYFQQSHTYSSKKLKNIYMHPFTIILTINISRCLTLISENIKHTYILDDFTTDLNPETKSGFENDIVQ